MGNKVSAVHGVKSEDFYEQGNAINEIWLGDMELVSRLPFGDSDMGQSGWPKGDWPKIPWHQFIIPLKRSLDTIHKNNYVLQAAALCLGLCLFAWGIRLAKGRAITLSAFAGRRHQELQNDDMEVGV